MKRTPLTRKTALAANPDRTRDWLQRSRRKLPPMSRKRQAETPERMKIREQVFERDHHMCQLMRLVPGHVCHGPLTPHHILKASQGGLYTLGNLTTLCAGANSWVEDFPDEAYSYGLVQRRGDGAQ